LRDPGDDGDCYARVVFHEDSEGYCCFGACFFFVPSCTSLLLTPQLIMRSVNPKQVGLIFRNYARKTHAKAVAADLNFLRISIACGKVRLSSFLPSFLPSSLSPPSLLPSLSSFLSFPFPFPPSSFPSSPFPPTNAPLPSLLHRSNNG